MSTCPGALPDGFDASRCWQDEGHPSATECTCTTWCGDPSEAGCCYCNHTDVYLPCPVVGYGCGMYDNEARCDCCTDEQWAATKAVAS